MPTTQEILDAVESRIMDMLGGGSVESFSETSSSAQMTKLDVLLDQREKLKQRIAAESGSMFGAIQPMRY